MPRIVSRVGAPATQVPAAIAARCAAHRRDAREALKILPRRRDTG